MIAIVNVSPKGTDLQGVHEYELRINHGVICKFKHQRKDGIAACLKAAADAAERAEVTFGVRMIERIKSREKRLR